MSSSSLDLCLSGDYLPQEGRKAKTRAEIITAVTIRLAVFIKKDLLGLCLSYAQLFPILLQPLAMFNILLCFVEAWRRVMENRRKHISRTVRPQSSNVTTQFLPFAFALYRASSAFISIFSISLISSVPCNAATPMLTVKLISCSP